VEVVYSGVLNASNYDYIQEWAFREDGMITPRAGSTGPTYFGPNDTITHVHNFTWRLDFDLNEPSGNSVYYTRHIENPNVPNSTATDFSVLIAREAGLDWVPGEYNTIKIVDRALKNALGHQTEYELVPHRNGTARHSEAFTKHDFWVTRSHAGESLFAEDLPGLVADGEPTVNQNLVEWYTQSIHHDPHRDEKRQTTPTIWTGFELETRLADDVRRKIIAGHNTTRRVHSIRSSFRSPDDCGNRSALPRLF
jgi:primary-amine oxidase